MKNIIICLAVVLVLNIVRAEKISDLDNINYDDLLKNELSQKVENSNSLEASDDKNEHSMVEISRALAALEEVMEDLLEQADNQRQKRLTYRYGKRMTYRYGKRAAMPYRFGKRSSLTNEELLNFLENHDSKQKRMTYRYGK